MSTKRIPPSVEKLAKKTGQALEDALVIGERRSKALMLRKRGKSYQDIGKELSISTQTARKDVLIAIADARGNEEEDTVMVRDLELERLDAMLNAIWPKVLRGDTFCVQQALKIMERRADYLGLDAPKRTEFLGAITTLTAESVTKLTDEELAKRTHDLLMRLTSGQMAPKAEKDEK